MEMRVEIWLSRICFDEIVGKVEFRRDEKNWIFGVRKISVGIWSLYLLVG